MNILKLCLSCQWIFLIGSFFKMPSRGIFAIQKLLCGGISGK